MGSNYNSQIIIKINSERKQLFQHHYQWQGAASVICRAAIEAAIKEAEAKLLPPMKEKNKTKRKKKK